MTEPEPDRPVEAGAETVALRSHAGRLIEAVLFASARPVTEADLALRLPPGVDLVPLLAELQAAYRFRGVNLLRIAGGWIFRTAPDLAGQLAAERVEPRKLTRAAVETLAIVAYHQPVTRGEIEEIRGVTIHRGTLDSLMEAGWVQPKGRKDSPGRPITWVTTQGFLEHFGLNGLADLPGLEELRSAGLLDARQSVSLGDMTPSDTGEEPEQEL
ncbi:MAG TPA: SMC-Scp complex subunit ScpB [Stellaceae bacterium]|nr:SMC-Scp complex subunit ScpB [Stellaceae bacterium]